MVTLGSKEEALRALEQYMSDKGLRPTRVGIEISGDPSFLSRLRDPGLTISARTLDRIWKYIGDTE